MSTPVLKIVMAQMDSMVGAISSNTERVIQAAQRAHDQYQADMIVFPELVLTGYPPEDLLLRPSLDLRIEKALQQIESSVPGIHIVLGYPRRVDGVLYNMAGVIYNGERILEYRKQCLPNYQVFDEKRYFSPGDGVELIEILGLRVAITVCEDIWQEQPLQQCQAQGADLVISLNASPYHMNKLGYRQQVLADQASRFGMPIVYVNLVGGQDELVFDGGSMVFDRHGACQITAPQFEEDLYLVEFELGEACRPLPQPELVALTPVESAYRALVLGVRDYVEKNRFRHVVLGLSGGIDSALTLAVAVDAIGPQRVEAVMMPFRYTSNMSLEDAAEQAALLGVDYRILSIEPVYNAFMEVLAKSFAGQQADQTEENLQARCRGVLLMALSNKTGSLVLTTGNKSEMAVGYSTLYGDMAGGFDVLKDVPKTLVFRLANYRNSLSPAIPQRVIDRPPSAELAPGQQDQDMLPPYDILDQILHCYIELDESAETIISQGFDRDVVYRVIRMVDLNEYKRRQAPIGIRITARGFGRDRRYPITSGWEIGE